MLQLLTILHFNSKTSIKAVVVYLHRDWQISWLQYKDTTIDYEEALNNHHKNSVGADRRIILLNRPLGRRREWL